MLSSHHALQRVTGVFTPFRPLTNKNFGIFWSGAFLSSIGFWIQTVGQGWQVLQLTNSAFLLGLVTFAATLPNIVLSLFGGVIVDRMKRRYLVLVTQILYMATAALLGLLTTLHVIQIWHIIAIALFNGIISSVSFPAWQTFIGELVPPHQLKQGIALNSMQFNLSRVIGPAIGGFSVGIFGIAGSYYLNALSYVAVIIPLFLLRPQERARTSNSQGIWRGLYEGIHYTLGTPALELIMLLVFLVVFLLFPYATLLPIFADQIFHIGASGLGILNAAAGVGALLGSLLVVVLTQRITHGPRILCLIALLGGIGCILFAIAPQVSLALPMLIVVGACSVMTMILSNTFAQSMVPEKMRGRIVSIWVLVGSGLGPFGNLIAGWVAQVLSVRTTLLINGLLCAVLAIMIIGIRQFSYKHTSTSIKEFVVEAEAAVATNPKLPTVNTHR